MQVTCLCIAYNFPHRLSGGKCNASDWCKSYRENVGEHCVTCNCMNGSGCDVEDGREGIKHCEAYLDMLRYDDGTRYPLVVNNIYEETLDRFYSTPL